MNAMMVVALVMAIPVLLLPAAFIWYLNIGGIEIALREARARKAALKETQQIKALIPSQITSDQTAFSVQPSAKVNDVKYKKGINLTPNS